MKAALEALSWADRGSALLMGLALIVGALVIWKRSGIAAAACALAGAGTCGFVLVFTLLAELKIRLGPYDGWLHGGLGVASSAAMWAPLAVALVTLARRRT